MIDATYPALRDARTDATTAALLAVFGDQKFAVLAAGHALDARWDDRLAARLLDVNLATAHAYGQRVAKALGATLAADALVPWLTINAGITAAAINDATRAALTAAADHTARAAVFDHLDTAAEGYAHTSVTTSATLGAHDGAQAGGAKSKTWLARTTSQRHGHLNRQTVPLGHTFSNGMRGPGDPAGGVSQTVNCRCSLGFHTEEQP